MTQEPDQVPCLTPLVRGAPSITPKMVFWQGRYISVAQLYVVSVYNSYPIYFRHNFLSNTDK